MLSTHLEQFFNFKSFRPGQEEIVQAIVNGQIVNIGDTIDATKIVAIRKNAIDIYFKEKTFTIKP